MSTFKERLEQIELEERLKVFPEEDSSPPPAEPVVHAEEGTCVHCAECGQNTFREQHSAIMCTNCGHGPFCNYCWQVHIRDFHPLLVQPYEEARRGIRTRARFLNHYLIRTVVKPAGFVLGLAALLAAAYFAYSERRAASPADTIHTPAASVGGVSRVELVELSSPVHRSDTASLTVHTTAGAACTIQVRYRSGPSRARGLEPGIADPNGRVTWRWRVGSQTTPGEWPIDVACASNNQSARLSVAMIVAD